MTEPQEPQKADIYDSQLVDTRMAALDRVVNDYAMVKVSVTANLKEVLEAAKKIEDYLIEGKIPEA